MLSRREFLAVAASAAAVTGLGGKLARKAKAQAITQEDLLRFTPNGQVTILHFADCHAQLKPTYYREPSVNLGAGDAHDLPPHVTGADFLSLYGIAPGSLAAYALTPEDFAALARSYGKVGGMDRLAALIKAIRAERGAGRVLLLDGGDTLQGSYTALVSKGADMVKVSNQLGVDAMTGHWEFTYGTERVLQFAGDKDKDGEIKAAFLAGNVLNDEWREPVFKAWRMFERGGVRLAVIGQAFPFTPIANPRWLMPEWSFGIRDNVIRERVTEARAQGADVVILLSHNGFDADRKLAGLVDGIDIILTGHTHDALLVPLRVNNTLLIGSGSHGKFLSRLDLEIKDGSIADYSYALIPVLSDAIAPEADMARLIGEIRAPHEAMLTAVLGKTSSLLYRRGNFNGTFDDLICQAMLEARDAEIALSPGFRWGPALLPGAGITWEDVYAQTALTYPACYRVKMSGAMLKELLEDVADNLFNKDPYHQQGGDMVRTGGLGYAINIDGETGRRISAMTVLKTGQPVDPNRIYAVAGWASVNQGAEGPPIWEVVSDYIKHRKVMAVEPNNSIKVMRG